MKSVSSRDIEENKKVEEKLRESELKYQKVIDELDVGFYQVTLDGKILTHNPTYNKILGFDISENLKNNSVTNFWQKPELREDYLKQLFRDNIAANYICYAIKKDGKKIVLQLNSHLIRDKEGKPIRIDGTFIDVTERFSLEKKLKESEKTYRSLFENSIACIAFHKIIYDSAKRPINYIFTDVNPAFEKILKIKRDKVIDRLATEVYDVEFPPYFDIYLKVAETMKSELFTTFFEPLRKHFKISAFSYEIGKFITVFGDITEERLKEIELKEVQSELEQIFNNSIPSYLIDKNLTIIRINDSFCSLFQINRDEIIGKKCYSLWNNAKCKSSDCLVNQFANSSEMFDYDMERELEDGSKIFCIVKSFPYRDSSGEIVGSIKNFINITKRKAIEEKLKSTLETTKKILDSLPIGMVLVGYDKKIESVNKVALKLLEIDDDFEILGKLCHNVMCVAEIDTCPILDMGQKMDQSERFLINRFGKKIPILKSVLPIKLGDNNYLLESFVDVSSLKETQEKLKESQEKYRDLLETSSMGIMEVNLIREIVEYTNPKFLNIIGYPKEEIRVKKAFFKFVHPEDAQELSEYRDSKELEFRIITKDGDIKWIEGTKLFHYNEKGEVTRLRLWINDISEKKKGESLKKVFTEKLEKKVLSRTKNIIDLYEKQRLYLDQIVKSSRFKTEFMATMSHELRTPLNAIIGFTDLLLESVFGELNEEQLEFVKDIDESSKHLLEMITHILDISKIEAGQVTLTVEKIHLNNLVNHLISTLKPLSNKKGLNIDLKGLKKEQFIFADRIKFKQIIYNLLSNAIKFTEKGKINFEFRDSKDMWEFIVKDTGIGIAEKDFNIIFKEFKRVKSPYVDSIPGSGLGLALTKRIVDLHRGDILFTSKIGEGTTITFTLPKNLRKEVKSENVGSFLRKL